MYNNNNNTGEYCGDHGKCYSSNRVTDKGITNSDFCLVPVKILRDRKRILHESTDLKGNQEYRSNFLILRASVLKYVSSLSGHMLKLGKNQTFQTVRGGGLLMHIFKSSTDLVSNSENFTIYFHLSISLKIRLSHIHQLISISRSFFFLITIFKHIRHLCH